MDLDTLTVWIRFVNSALAGVVAGLCFLKVNRKHPDPARNTRIIGLGILCTAIAWGSFANLNTPFNPRIPLITIGLCFSYYGMRRYAAGERHEFKN